MNSSGIPCKIAMWRGSGPTGYVIKATGSIPICDGATTVDVNGKYFTNISGAVFIAKNNTSGVVTSEQIDSIKGILNNFTTFSIQTVALDGQSIVLKMPSLDFMLTFTIL